MKQACRGGQINMMLSALAGLALGIAWLMPGSKLGAGLSFLSLLTLVQIVIAARSVYSLLFCFGFISNSIAFYWLVPTIQDFGGYPLVVSIFLYLLFLVFHTLVFLLFGFLFKQIRIVCPQHPVFSAFLAWASAKYIYPEIFPWDFAHSQAAYPLLIQIADLGGVILVTGFLFLSASLIFNLFTQPRDLFRLLSKTSLILLVLFYSSSRIGYFQKIPARDYQVGIVQSKVQVQHYQGVSYLAANPQRYFELSKKMIAEDRPDLVLWPETVILDPINTSSRSVFENPNLPYFPNTNLVTGSLTEDDQGNYNSALAILANGQVLSPYHKQILMPFGEYMPFANIFPYLATLNPNLASISPGKSWQIFDLKNGLRIVPLICYEDLKSKISLSGARAGANLIVNLSNDAWFGGSVAAAQHNQLALFRAVENRRYLLRATNTGLTSVIDPVGKIQSQLPPNVEGLIKTKIRALSEPSVYVNFCGSYTWSIIVIIGFILILYSRFKR